MCKSMCRPGRRVLLSPASVNPVPGSGAVRWAALANIPVMAGAIWFVHAGQGFFIFAGKNGYEYALFLLGATVAQVLLGPGAFTLKK